MSAANIFSTGAAPYAGLSPKQSMVEQGRQAISVVKFNSLCEYLGISQSLVLTAVGARLVGMELKAYRDQQRLTSADWQKTACVAASSSEGRSAESVASGLTIIG